MNRGRGKHLCRIRKQDQQGPGGAGPDAGIFGLEAGEDVNDRENKWQCERGGRESLA